jgi:AAA domain
VSEPNLRWLRNASDLLLEADPGPTPFAIESLLAEAAIAAIQGLPKVGKTWVVLELALALALVTGRKAFGTFEIPRRGPVILILEESGEQALRRRLDRLARGYALAPAALDGLYVAANRRVRLNDPTWQASLIAAAQKIRPRAIFLDPLVRLKGASVEENSQREMGPVLEYLRDLRDASEAAVTFVHHTGHAGTHLRGTLDLEAFWESKITISREDGMSALTAEHREAEATPEFRYRLAFDGATESLRLDPDRRVDELREHVAAYLADHPDASGNEVRKAVRGRKSDVLDLMKEIKGQALEEPERRFPSPRNQPEPAGTTSHSPLVPARPLSPLRGRGSGTAAADVGANGSGTASRLLLNDGLDENSRRFLLECQELVEAGKANWVEEDVAEE